MSTVLIQERLLQYQCQTLAEQESALKEIAQEIALQILSQTGFFNIAAFQGGTCLRILYGLVRFSEDLDFVLTHPDKNFDWKKYIVDMQSQFMSYGYKLEISDRTKTEKSVKTTFLKADSEGGLLILKDTRTKRIIYFRCMVRKIFSIAGGEIRRLFGAFKSIN